MKPRQLTFVLILVVLLTGCAGAQAGSPATAQPETAATPNRPAPQVGVTSLPPTEKPTIPGTRVIPQPSSPPTESPGAASLEPTAQNRQPVSLGPEAWKQLPVIPVIGETPKEVYQRGLELGNNPNAFSKVGDCGATPSWFLGDFDHGPRFYRLGDYTSLQPVIDAFQGSYDRTSLAGKKGFNASSVFTVLWADPVQCQPGETPLACEYRVHRPAYAFIMLGSNDVFHPDNFEPQMRKIIEFSIESGVIPILSTKVDNAEGDDSINQKIAELALEYDMPLWNFWLAAQDLPDGGLQEDGVHLTWSGNRFDDPAAMQKAWPLRNLTALQTLDAVWRAVSSSTNGS